MISDSVWSSDSGAGSDGGGSGVVMSTSLLTVWYSAMGIF